MADMPRRGFTLPLPTSATTLGPAVHSDPESGRVCVWVHWSGFTGKRALSRRGFSHCSAINQYLISAVKQATLVTTARLEICVSHEGQLTTHHWSPHTTSLFFSFPAPHDGSFSQIHYQHSELISKSLAKPHVTNTFNP